MALSTIIKQTCKECGKVAVEKSRIQFGDTKIISLECGHVTSEDSLTTKQDVASILNGTKLFKYQVEGTEFLAAANARALLADEQGLGKTYQVMALLKLYREQLLPAVIVAPTSIKLQWLLELIDRCGVEGYLTQVIGSGKELAAPGFDIYVITYDLLKNENTFNLVKDNIKTIILDECQKIKNHLSERAKAVQKFAKSINAEHIIGMSGTPIKNNAGEYFTILNLLQPRMFPHYQKFIQDDCDSYNNGWGYKVGGLKNPERFHEKTKDFILRRTKDEVLPDLPELSRKFFHVELDRRLNKAYSAALDELEKALYDDEVTEFERGSSLIAIMTKMRQITGISKVEECTEFVTDFLESTDRKMVIFAHHHSVVNLLEKNLTKYSEDNGNLTAKPLNLTAQLSGDERQRMVQRFKTDGNRVMIASTLAAGEGLNLQFCSDAVMLERQWNPANEEQAEGRFHRYGQSNPVSVTYMLASGTIDEYFTELVESKRAIVASTLNNKEIQWDQSSLMTELANILVTKGKKAWTLDSLKG